MKNLLYILTCLAILFTACKKDEETEATGTTVTEKITSLSGLKDGVFEVDGSEVKPTQIVFTGANLLATNSGSTTLNDLIIETGADPESKTYPLNSSTITADTLRIEYQTGSETTPIHWYSISGQVQITNTGTTVNADFKDVVFAKTTDTSQTKTISANLTGAIQ